MPRKATPPAEQEQEEMFADDAAAEYLDAETEAEAEAEAKTEGTPEAGEAEEVPAKVNPALIPVPLEMLGESVDVPEDEWTEAPLNDPAEKDPAQVRLEADVKDAHDKWVATGRPHAARSPRKRLVVAPEHGPAVRKMLGDAARHHKIRIVLGRPVHDQDGREVITYSARDRVERTRTRHPDTYLARVREWAKTEGIDVSERGRIAEDVLTRFETAEKARAVAEANEPVADTAGK